MLIEAQRSVREALGSCLLLLRSMSLLSQQGGRVSPPKPMTYVSELHHEVERLLHIDMSWQLLTRWITMLFGRPLSCDRCPTNRPY